MTLQLTTKPAFMTSWFCGERKAEKKELLCSLTNAMLAY